MKGGLSLVSLAAALVVVGLIILRLSNAGSSSNFSKIAIGAAIVLLVLRQIVRRQAGKRSKGPEPDPESRLHLND